MCLCVSRSKIEKISCQNYGPIHGLNFPFTISFISILNEFRSEKFQSASNATFRVRVCACVCVSVIRYIRVCVCVCVRIRCINMVKCLPNSWSSSIDNNNEYRGGRELTISRNKKFQQNKPFSLEIGRTKTNSSTLATFRRVDAHGAFFPLFVFSPSLVLCVLFYCAREHETWIRNKRTKRRRRGCKIKYYSSNNDRDDVEKKK